MIMSIVSLLVILGIGYVWVTRGFFSALVHLMCTIIAGAVGYRLIPRAPGPEKTAKHAQAQARILKERIA